MWRHETEVGVFRIRFDPLSGGRFILGIGAEDLGAYYSPEAAADDVFLQKTGWPAWDDLSSPSRPEDLSHWSRVDCTA